MWGGGGAYNAWVAFLDRWAAGELVDPAGLPALHDGLFSGDGMARVTNRLTDAVSDRMRLWADRLTRAIGDARDEFSIARALTQARDGLRAVRVLTCHPGLPADLSTGLIDLVDRQVRAMQTSLEEQVERLRQGGAPRHQVEARLRTMRDNALTAVLAEPAGPPGPSATSVPPPGWAADPAAQSRRRVIVN
jgi:hypothetical protein